VNPNGASWSSVAALPIASPTVNVGSSEVWLPNVCSTDANLVGGIAGEALHGKLAAIREAHHLNVRCRLETGHRTAHHLNINQGQQLFGQLFDANRTADHGNDRD